MVVGTGLGNLKIYRRSIQPCRSPIIITSPQYLIFSKVARPTAGPSSAVIRIATEKTDIVEVKGGGHLSGPRTSGVPHALAQIFSSLHVLAAAAILKALTKNVILNNVLCKGLLINRKESMVMCKLEAKISALDSSEFTLSYSSIEMDDFHMSLKDICAGIDKLFE